MRATMPATHPRHARREYLQRCCFGRATVARPAKVQPPKRLLPAPDKPHGPTTKGCSVNTNVVELHHCFEDDKSDAGAGDMLETKRTATHGYSSPLEAEPEPRPKTNPLQTDDPFTELPDEVIVSILHMLSPSALDAARSTCPVLCGAEHRYRVRVRREAQLYGLDGHWPSKPRWIDCFSTLPILGDHEDFRFALPNREHMVSLRTRNPYETGQAADPSRYLFWWQLIAKAKAAMIKAEARQTEHRRLVTVRAQEQAPDGWRVATTEEIAVVYDALQGPYYSSRIFLLDMLRGQQDRHIVPHVRASSTEKSRVHTANMIRRTRLQKMWRLLVMPTVEECDEGERIRRSLGLPRNATTSDIWRRKWWLRIRRVLRKPVECLTAPFEWMAAWMALPFLLCHCAWQCRDSRRVGRKTAARLVVVATAIAGFYIMLAVVAYSIL